MTEKKMHVQVEVKCNNCGRKLKADVPVVCDMEEDQVLYCNVVGELEEYVPKCKCGSKDFKMEKKDLIKKVKGAS